MKLGTLRNPGADLSRLPVGFDLRAISVAEGVRAALATAVVILANEWLRWPPLVYMALAANLTCFCDVGGPIRPRLVALLAFTALGALIWSGFGLLRPLGLPLVVPLACLVIFANSLIRVWGLGAQAVGNVLTVVLVLALDRPLGAAEAGMVAAMFLAGGLWATLLTMVVWRLHPYRPARVEVAEVWRLLVEAVRDMRGLLRWPNAGTADWDGYARAHRRAIRETIEQARMTVMELARMRGPLSLRASQALIRLEAGDQLFGAIIALTDLLEVAGPARRAAADQLLRVLQPLLAVIARSILADTIERLPRLDRAIAAAVARSQADPVLHAIAESIADRLRIAVRLSAPAGYLPGSGLPGEPVQPLAEQLWGPIAANLTWRSAMLRHAARAAAVAAPALVATLIWQSSFTHWLTITVVLTMQPFYATTWQRALERIGGTVLGGLVGAGLALLAHTPTALVGLMFPLSVLGFAARRVSYGAFIACLTPQLVVLVELLDPAHSSWEIAAMRALFTVMGGAIALAGCLLLWPSWEPERLRQELRDALATHAAYADAILAQILGEGEEAAAEQARRAAGVASNNLETSLARALQEPRRSQRPRLEAALLAASTLRRIVGPLSALYHDPTCRDALPPESWRQWREWIGASLAALAEGRSPPARPAGATIEPLARIGRQIELLEGALRRFW
jgi:uncharacterized membrane protein YccC